MSKKTTKKWFKPNESLTGRQLPLNEQEIILELMDHW